MYILLGWNDTGTTEENYKAVVRQFIDKVFAEIPNCKITLMGLQVPSRDGFANNYGIRWKSWLKINNNRRLFSDRMKKIGITYKYKNYGICKINNAKE